MKKRWGVFLGVTSLFTMGIDKGCVSQPTTDTIVTTSNATIEGTITEVVSSGFPPTFKGFAQLKVNSTNLPWTTDEASVWRFNNVSLNTGVNVIQGQTKRKNSSGVDVLGTITPFILERKTDLSNRGTQKVFFDYSDAGIDDQIKAIAEHTLNGPLTTAQKDQFVAGVKAKIKDYFEKTYQDYSIQIVSSADSETHTIRFHGEDTCSLYGESPGDYKNQTKNQTSEIYVGTFKCVCVDNDRLLNETPAKKTDTLQTRIDDIGYFIGRTVIHEFGHSLGLTAEGNDKLHGCEGMHNCESYDDSNPSDRFDDGFYIMDPGPKSLLHARIGEKDDSVRGTRKPAKFNSYNRSYLKIIH